jgi:hypothetical protein
MSGSGIGTPVVSGGNVTDLITLVEMKEHPGFTTLTAEQETQILTLIEAATADFENFWGNYGVQRSITERIGYQQIVRDSPNADKIWLSQYPIASVTSITDSAGNIIASTNYWIDVDSGCLRTVGGWQIPQDTNGFSTYWSIVYVAGRVASNNLVPANIKLACKMWVATLYKRPDREVTSKSVGGLSLSFATSEGGLPETIQRMIRTWKKREV